MALDNVLYDGVTHISSSCIGAVDITVPNGECCALTGDVLLCCSTFYLQTSMELVLIFKVVQ